MLEPDVRLQQNVENAVAYTLAHNAQVEAAKINVEARHGRVILSGTVRSYAEREDAERAAWTVPGVVSVDDQIAIEVVAHLTEE